MKINTLLLATMLSLPGLAYAEPDSTKPLPIDSAILRMASYDGTWTGSLNCLYDPGLWPEDECETGLQFQIEGETIAVEQTVRTKAGNAQTTEINPGQFELAKLSTNAIAVSLNTGQDQDGTWVETWSFVMTLTDSDHMLVHWTRIVNNLDMPKDKKGSKFSSAGMGVLTRKATM